MINFFMLLGSSMMAIMVISIFRIVRGIVALSVLLVFCPPLVSSAWQFGPGDSCINAFYAIDWRVAVANMPNWAGTLRGGVVFQCALQRYSKLVGQATLHA
jgi:hypothetical protein